MIRDYIEDAIENIDAAVFSGDAFHDAEHRAALREAMARWERELTNLEKTDD